MCITITYVPASPPSPFLLSPPKYTAPLLMTTRQNVPALSQEKCSTFHTHTHTYTQVTDNTVQLNIQIKYEKAQNFKLCTCISEGI